MGKSKISAIYFETYFIYLEDKILTTSLQNSLYIYIPYSQSHLETTYKIPYIPSHKFLKYKIAKTNSLYINFVFTK